MTDPTPVTAPELRAALAQLLAAATTTSLEDTARAQGLALELLGRPLAPTATPEAARAFGEALAPALEAFRPAVELLGAMLGRLEASGAVGAGSQDLDALPRPGWPSYRQVFRWAYAAVLELARLELDATNATAEDSAAWPAGQSWDELGASSRATFMDLARDRLGISRAAFLAVVRSGLVETEDLWDGQTEIPAPRVGMLVQLEGQDEPQVVAEVDATTGRVTFQDGSYLEDWPDLVEDVGTPWPPFASALDLAELEVRRQAHGQLEGEEAEDLARAVDRLEAEALADWMKGDAPPPGPRGTITWMDRDGRPTATAEITEIRVRVVDELEDDDSTGRE